MAAQSPANAVVMAAPLTVTQDGTARAGLTNIITSTAVLRWNAPLLSPPFNAGAMQPKGNSTKAGGQFSSRSAEVAFDTDARYVDLRLRAHASLRYRLWVNEQASSATVVALPNGTGSDQFLHIDFGAISRPDPRRIVVEFEETASQPITLWDVRVGPLDYIGPPATPSPRVLIVGDSFCRGEGGTTARAYSYARTFGRMLGWGEVWSHSTSYSGTGLVHTNDANVGNYGDRLALDVTPYKPDLVVVQGSVNDSPHPGQVGPALTAYVTRLRAALPQTSVVVTSPLVVATPTAAHLVIAAEMKSAAAALGVPYADAVSPVVFTGNATAGDTTPNGSGSADWARSGSDKTHPTNDGAFTLARHVAGLVGKALGVPIP
jgi:lysophospholipase L1-like esterase